jgi:threonine aldolase
VSGGFAAPFALSSDNYAPALPEALAAIAAANHGHSLPYGEDPLTQQVCGRLRQELGVPEAVVLPVFSGTGANVLCLHALLRPWEGVVCATSAHITTDETGAPERMTGVKMLAVPAPGGKLTPELVEPLLERVGDVHQVQPGVVSISQVTEYGTLYTPEELRALADFAHRNGLRVHVDGARISNAAASLDVPLAALCGEAGIDALSFGGTKAGLIGAEAVVLCRPDEAPGAAYLRKQVGQLASKQRYLSAQLGALLEDGLWRRSAAHANAMARRLADGVRDVPGLELAYPVQANAVFALIPVAAIEPLRERCEFHGWPDDPRLVRWMCAWDTRAEDVDALIAAVREIVPSFSS